MHVPSFQMRAFLATLLILFYPFVGLTAPPIMPESRLQQVGLESDNASILAYLRDGFPDTARWPAGQPFYRHTAISQTYYAILQMIVERKLLDAVPVLQSLLQDPFPSHLRHDFEAAEVAEKNPSPNPDFAVEARTAQFRAWCAIDLAQLKNDGSADVIKSRIKLMTPEVQRKLTEPYAKESTLYIAAYASLCESLAALGDKDGVQFLIDCLPYVTNDPDSIVRPLQIATGQGFGPTFDLPKRLHQTEKQKWYAWWKQAKPDFDPKRECILNKVKYYESLPTPTSLHEYLDAARDSPNAPTDTYIPAREESATRWMSANAAAYGPALVKITNDPDERAYTRIKAMKWYARSVGSAALPDLEEYALKKVPFDPADSALKESMATEARALVLEYCPDSRLAKQLRRELAR